MANLELIKSLRESTGCGIADCNKALAECGDDNLEAAIDWLRKKGLTKAAKKGDRIASEGLIGIKVQDKQAGMVEINSETDFVARNEVFQGFVQEVSQLTLQAKGDLDALQKAVCPSSGNDVETESQSKTGVIGEKITVRRTAYVELSEAGVVESYIHNRVTEGMGKIGVLVALKSTADPQVLHELGKNLAMHIAASKPDYLTIADVDKVAVERERDVCREQVLAAGTKPELVEKIIDGKINTFYKSVVLLEQVYVIDGKKSVKEILAEESKAAGASIEISDFKLFILGEGIEKKENDFASEVSSMASGK